MKEALYQAKCALKDNEIPVGAVIVDNITKKIIISTYNLVENYNNATFHAEILAINKACEILGSKYLVNCSMYVTLEPCVMCAAAIAYTKIHSLFYATSDLKQGAVENGIRFFTLPSCFHRPQIYPNIHEQEAATLMKSFFKAIRERELKIDK
jgi:tRNA(adenine34) deaminase